MLPKIDTVSLREHPVFFALDYSTLKQGLLPLDPDDDSEEAEEENLDGKVNEHPPSKSNELAKKVVCQNCLSCAFRLLFQYRLFSTAYENLYLHCGLQVFD